MAGLSDALPEKSLSLSCDGSDAGYGFVPIDVFGAIIAPIPYPGAMVAPHYR
jgi:hypothetical protein